MQIIDLIKRFWSQIHDPVVSPQSDEQAVSTKRRNDGEPEAPRPSGMKPNEIKAEITRRGLSLTTLAAEAECTVPEISMCISGDRIYPRIRRIIANRLGKPVERIFGRHHPKPKRRSWCKAA